MPRKYDDFDLLEELREIKLPTFTVTDVTNHIMLKHSAKFGSNKNARQFVYRRMKDLYEGGQIKKISPPENRVSVYALHELSEADAASSSSLELDGNQSVELALLNKIKECKSEMLLCIGEAEAMKEWSAIVVSLPEVMKEKYQSAKERSAILLGKLKTYETLLEHYRG